MEKITANERKIVKSYILNLFKNLCGQQKQYLCQNNKNIGYRQLVM